MKIRLKKKAYKILLKNGFVFDSKCKQRGRYLLKVANSIKNRPLYIGKIPVINIDKQFKMRIDAKYMNR